MTKLIRFWAVIAMLAASQFASPAFAGFNSLFLSIRLDVATTPTPAVQPVVIGDFTYSIACNLATFATPAATITLNAGNGTTPVSTFGNATSTALTGFPNDCTYRQISRPAAPTGFIWVGTPPDVVQTGINGEAPPAQFINTLTQAFTITTVASPAAGGSVSCTPNPVPSGQTSICTASTNSGYTFAGFSTNSCGAASTNNPYTTSALAADCTVTGTFTLTPVNGVCGSANTQATATAPTANLCALGTASTVTSSVNQFTWSCAGNATGTTSSCAAPRTYSVTSSVSGGNGTITPTSTQTVASGAKPTFTLAPSAGFSATVSGTCGGTLAGNTFTTNAVVADCTVIASFTLIPVNGVCGSANADPTGSAPSTNLCSTGTASAVASNVSQFTWSCAGIGSGTTASCAAPRTYTVTSSVSGSNGTITPASTQTVASGAQPTFTVAPSSGFSASVGGTCGGNLVGTTYTANAIVANCTVIATFSPNSFAITTVASPANGGTVVCTPNPVTFGATASCVATPAPGYVIAPFVASAAPGPAVKAISPAASGGISGCGGVGSSTNPFITAPITAACTVTANFVLITVPVSALAVAANGGTVNCAPNPVSYGSTSTCTATANAGFTLTSISGCGGTTTTTSPFVTGPVTAPCTVTANFTPVAVPQASVPVPALGGGALLLLVLLTGIGGSAYVLRAKRQ